MHWFIDVTGLIIHKTPIIKNSFITYYSTKIKLDTYHGISYMHGIGEKTMLKSKSRMFKGLVEKIDIALSEGTNFDEIAGKLKNVHIKVRDEYIKPLPTDLCTQLAMNELESR